MKPEALAPAWQRVACGLLGLPMSIVSIFLLCDSAMDRGLDGDLLSSLLPGAGSGFVFLWIAVTGRLPTGRECPASAPPGGAGDADTPVWSSQPANQPWKPSGKA